jgi:hypothetical protein
MREIMKEKECFPTPVRGVRDREAFWGMPNQIYLEWGVGATSSGRLGAMQIPEGHGPVVQGRSALITMIAASIKKKVLVDKSRFIIFTLVS